MEGGQRQMAAEPRNCGPCHVGTETSCGKRKEVPRESSSGRGAGKVGASAFPSQPSQALECLPRAGISTFTISKTQEAFFND